MPLPSVPSRNLPPGGFSTSYGNARVGLNGEMRSACTAASRKTSDDRGADGEGRAAPRNAERESDRAHARRWLRGSSISTARSTTRNTTTEKSASVST